MDAAAIGLTTALSAISRTRRRLQEFARRLNDRLGWKAVPNFVRMQSLLLWGTPSQGATLGFGINRGSSGEQSIIFSIILTWDAEKIDVQSFVEDEDGNRDEISRCLWRSPEFAAETIEQFGESLDKAVEALESSIWVKAVADYLATVERR